MTDSNRRGLKYPKRKGSKWERDAVKLLNEAFPGTWKKIPGSGSIGTILNEPMLKPDLLGHYKHMSKRIAAEAKDGYGGSKSMTIQRAWFNKIAKQAAELYALPMLLLKFSGAKEGTKYFVAIDFDVWIELMKEWEELYNENISLRELGNE